MGDTMMLGGSRCRYGAENNRSGAQVDIVSPLRNHGASALITLPEMFNQQFSKDPDLSRGVVPRWSDNVDPDFGERIATH
jgi:hypothetical protein